MALLPHPPLQQVPLVSSEVMTDLSHLVHEQWVNCLWNNIFINLLPLPLPCEISEALVV